MTLCWSCSSARHVPKGEYLLDKSKIIIEGDAGGLKGQDFNNYLRQQPNHKVLGALRLQLGMYNLSGRDSTRWWNRWMRRMGQPPVIYNRDLTVSSATQLKRAMVNHGFLEASVAIDTLKDEKHRKITVGYRISPGEQHKLGSVSYNFTDPFIRHDVMADSSKMLLRPGDPLDRTLLEAERTGISERLRQRGYYNFTKEYIHYSADTVAGSKEVALTVNIDSKGARPCIIRNVSYEIPSDDGTVTDTVRFKPGISAVYGPDRYITPKVLDNHSFITPGTIYDERNVTKTYESLSRLGILKSMNISMLPPADSLPADSIRYIDATVRVARNKKQSASVELEGTNSEGDFGFGAGVTYQHRNVSHASNTVTAKMRVSYESLSGDFTDLINNRYTEYGMELGMTFPRFIIPFANRDFRKRIKATSEVAVNFNYQERPEYTRVIAGAGWKYKWTSLDNRRRRTLDIPDISYVYLPKSTKGFIDQIAPNNPLLRYSYEDHFIMRMGYTFILTNRRINNATPGVKQRQQRNTHTLRTQVETAGNLLYGISSAIGQKRHDGVYRIFGIDYSQYVKGEVDYSETHKLGTRHTLAWRSALGVGVPYGNSKALPFEKRFYAGGANGVRGWGVRTLGPGSYDSRNSVSDFIHQCGDIRLDLNAEYRVKLFWVIEGALFIDAGNIWTIRDYPSQPGGVFRFDSFWEQIALAYGAGIRLDFNYFLIRFDLGMKAHNPARGEDHWPLVNPKWHRDATFHFSVGYPF